MFFQKQKKLLVGALVCTAFAGLILYYNNFRIPDITKKTEAEVKREIDEKALPKRKVAVVTAEEGISRYTELTEQVISERIKIIDMPSRFVIKGAVRDIGAIAGKTAKEDIRCGEQILLDSLSNGENWHTEYQRLKEYEISSIVAGEVNAGNIVDIIVSYGNGDYDVVIPKTKVIKLIDPLKAATDTKSPGANGKRNTPGQEDGKDGGVGSQEASGYTIVIALDEEQYRDMELAKIMGQFETRLYIDENQPASKRTFNYTEVINRTKLPVISNKTGVAVTK